MSTHTAAASPAGRSAFISNRLASILAIAPLGVWTVLHLWKNLTAFQGAEAWQKAVTGHSHAPALWFTSFVIVILPLLLHTVWGLRRMWTSRPNNPRYGYFANLRYVLQRLSAIGVLFFLGAHVWLAFLSPRVLEGHPEQFNDLAAEMFHHPPTFIVYMLGTLGVSYHLANGIHGVAMGWGFASSRDALKRVETLVLVLFLVFLAMSWGSIYALRTAGAVLPMPANM